MDPSTSNTRKISGDEEKGEQFRYNLRSRKTQNVTETDANVREGSEFRTGES